MSRSRRAALLATVVAVAITGTAGACLAQATPQRSDTVFQRAQRLVNDGNAGAGRSIVDSVLGATPEGSPTYVDALFWRATLADSAERARRDYLRIAMEFSLSPRAEDALLRLAQMELARGDRAAAKKLLDRLALEHSNGASRAQGAYWMARALLDEGSLAPACASLADARAHVSSADVELSNQITYYARPCAGVQRAADAARADSTARTDSIARADSTAKADSAARKASGGAKRAPVKGPAWSAQVAAYATEADAERLAKRLSERGYDARVTAQKPYRVRIGRFTKRAEAVELVTKLKAANMSAIVVEAEKL